MGKEFCLFLYNWLLYGLVNSHGQLKSDDGYQIYEKLENLLLQFYQNKGSFTSHTMRTKGKMDWPLA